MTVTRGQATQLRNFWYVIARSKDLRSTPLARKLNGRALAVFRDDHGRARVLDAVCPHRGAHLGYGTVEDVRQGKYFELDLATSEAEKARALAAEVADKVLANPVIESYRIEVD